ncbi:MAG: deoxyuridine 5'-triphosphate nucleotidohydrolase [Bacillota bacterium]|nr:deoxyuridine 5'-triphosphate nucleotidohydrolase [Bacillota bacterium]
MEKIAQFEKVSFEQFKADYIECMGDEIGVQDAYDHIQIPKRATTGSAGYDLISPVFMHLNPGKGLRIPTGLRVKISDGWMLLIMPKSGLGMKNRFQLDNTLGLIDSDYYNSSNEGHIMVPMRNNFTTDGFKDITINPGKAFAQAVFVPFGITSDDEAQGIRDGGFGSTNA